MTKPIAEMTRDEVSRATSVTAVRAARDGHTESWDLLVRSLGQDAPLAVDTFTWDGPVDRGVILRQLEVVLGRADLMIDPDATHLSEGHASFRVHANREV